MPLLPRRSEMSVSFGWEPTSTPEMYRQALGRGPRTSLPDRISQDTVKRTKRVPEANLLALRIGTAVIADADLEDA